MAMTFWFVSLVAWLMVMGSIVILNKTSSKAFGRRVDTIVCVGWFLIACAVVAYITLRSSQR
jgi:hypothetical protein